MGKRIKDETMKRIRLPEEDEIFGVVEKMLGDDRVQVRCVDGKTRIARIPGKMRKRVWIREGDVVLVKPWDFQPERADVTWRYTRVQVDWLKRKGKLDERVLQLLDEIIPGA